MKYVTAMESPVGTLTLAEENGALTEVRFGMPVPEECQQTTPVLLQAQQELLEYFLGERKTFTVPLKPAGTPFQMKCWQALLQIPYGETRTYAQQAQMIGNEKACRAAGMANHRNPISIMIPCHRVIGKNGTLTGYGGGLNIKEQLLQLERMNSK